MASHRKLLSNMFSVAPGVWGMKHAIVNFYMVENSEDNSWVLIDTGLYWSKSRIKKMAKNLFGEGSKPSAIILTHGHFDHVGTVADLCQEWDVPVYAHFLEIPYLTGRSSYPPPDPTVGGGLMATMAGLYPKKPINIWHHVLALPNDETIPGLPGWRWIHTPGHSPGHISLFRQDDKVLIAGDAFVTTRQESAMAVMTQKKELNGPPKYFTCDWSESEKSIRRLAYLKPAIAATGHGMPMEGEELKHSLEHLIQHFNEEAIPAKGRYVDYPAVADVNGVVYVPPAETNHNGAGKFVWPVFGATAALTLGLFLRNRNINKKRHYENMMDVEYNY